MAIAVLVGAPLFVNAGFLSFVSNIFSLVKDASPTLPATAYNSQTIPVLKAALNIDPNPGKGGGDICVVSDTALCSEEGPSGTLADIEDRPPTSDQISIYVVREGDSLSQIAKMFNVSASTIVWANDIERGSLIRPGETLIILPITGVRHTVEKGETLKGIVKKYDGNLAEVLSYNDLSEDAVLSIGNIVVIPDGTIAAPTYSSYSTVVAGSGGLSYSGYYIRPANGPKTQGLHGYNGIDIGAPYGGPIVASAAGTVIISRSGGWNGGYGNYIVITHDNGTQTLYAHTSQNIVWVGQYVVKGQVIGYIGSTGRSTGPHVHFEVRGAANPF